MLLQTLARDAFPLVLKEPGLSLSPCIISSFSTPGEAVSGRQPISRYLKILRENDKDRFSADLLQIPCFVAFAGYILHQQNLSCSKPALFSQGCFDFNFSVQQNDKLELGRGVEVVVVTGSYLPERYRFSPVLFRKRSDIP